MDKGNHEIHFLSYALSCRILCDRTYEITHRLIPSALRLGTPTAEDGVTGKSGKLFCGFAKTHIRPECDIMVVKLLDDNGLLHGIASDYLRAL